jgi:hypothetical protein
MRIYKELLMEIIEDAQFFVVELDNGEQEFFDSPYYAFKFAKVQEEARRGSVDYVAIGMFYDEEANGTVYRGQQLRYILRALDNPVAWIKTVSEVLSEREDSEDS